MVTRVAAAMLVLLLTGPAVGYYSHLKPNVQKCFVEEVGPDMDSVTVHYNTTSHSIRFEVRSSRRDLITDIVKNDRAGAFQFITIEGVDGQYSICATSLEQQSPYDGKQHPVKLTLRVDKSDKHRLIELQRGNNPLAQAIQAGNLDDNDQLNADATTLQRTAYYLSDLIIEIYDMRTEAAAMVIRTTRLKNTADNTFNRIIMLACLTCLVSGFIFYANYTYMKCFLREKKMV